MDTRKSRSTNDAAIEYLSSEAKYVANISSILTQQFGVNINDANIISGYFENASNILRKNPTMLASAIALILYTEGDEISNYYFDEFFNTRYQINKDISIEKQKYALYRYYKYASKYYTI